jgi:hypothetical protein
MEPRPREDAIVATAESLVTFGIVRAAQQVAGRRWIYLCLLWCR